MVRVTERVFVRVGIPSAGSADSASEVFFLHADSEIQHLTEISSANRSYSGSPCRPAMKIALPLFLLLSANLLAFTPAEKLTIQKILPTPQESEWLEIPWRTDLWAARHEAAEAGKPIYLWQMDGHPLGCT